MSVALANELEAAGLCANALTLNGARDHDRLLVLLERRLDAAVRQSTWLVDEGADLAIAAPSLREAAGRAASYYERQGDSERQRRAEHLLARLVEAD